MHQGTTQTLFALLRSAIFGTCLWAKEKEQLVPEQLSEMIKLSKTHDIAHLLAHG